MDPSRIWKTPWRWYRYGLFYFTSLCSNLARLTISEEMMACCYPLEEIKKRGIDFDVFRSMASCKGADVRAHRQDEKYAIVSE
jgi:glutathione gamma-glutamylcysteinyltransferase